MNNLDRQQDDIEDIITEPKKKLLNMFGGVLRSDKKIGEMNGRWAALFKIMLVSMSCLIPTMLGWMIWVSSNIYDADNFINANENNHNRIEELEKTDITRATLSKQLETLNTRIENLPPTEWRKRIEKLEDNFDMLNSLLINLDKNNNSDHIKLTTILENNGKTLQEIKVYIEKK